MGIGSICSADTELARAARAITSSRTILHADEGQSSSVNECLRSGQGGRWGQKESQRATHRFCAMTRFERMNSSWVIGTLGTSWVDSRGPRSSSQLRARRGSSLAGWRAISTISYTDWRSRRAGRSYHVALSVVEQSRQSTPTKRSRVGRTEWKVSVSDGN